ncbi:hypothetical protein QOT17_016615 [Balamuthia mandrillaris]
MPGLCKNITRAFLLAPCTFVVHVVLAAYFVATFAWLGCCISLDKPFFWVILSSYLPLALWGTLCFKTESRINKNTHKDVDDSRAPTPFGEGTGAEESGADSEKETDVEDEQEAICWTPQGTDLEGQQQGKTAQTATDCEKASHCVV